WVPPEDENRSPLIARRRSQYEISPVPFRKNVPAVASTIPRGEAVGMRCGFGAQIAGPAVVIVSDRDVEADNVAGLWTPKSASRKKVAEPTRVERVDGIKRNPRLYHKSSWPAPSF